MSQPRRIVLIHKRAPGDTAVLTALPRDIHAAYPGQFEIGVDTNCMSIWDHNPHIVPVKKLEAKGKVERLKLTYGKGIRDQNFETVHFLAYFHKDFEVQARVRVPLSLPYPDLHLSEEEKSVSLVKNRYWAFLSGGKNDFTAKVWASAHWQETIDQLNALGIPCVQIGGTDKGHWHPEIKNVLNLVGKTSLRDMMRVIYHADGVICGITSAMHFAAGLQKPCVVLAGGREAWWWEAYVRENSGLGGADVAAKLEYPHRYLHTIGLLDCCQRHGCWKNKVIKIQDDTSVCKYPIIKPGQAVPKCLDMITPNHVIEAVMSYYEDKSLPPIKEAEHVVRYMPGATTIPAELPTVNVETQFQREVAGVQKTTPPESASDDSIFDNPVIGGKFTVCVLFYGPAEYHDLHMRCLNSIITTCPPARIDLRVASNALCDETAAVLERLAAHKVITKYYRHNTNDLKYPVMREMFHDPDCPITTNYTLWFDDDSVADRNAQWLKVLAGTIIQSPDAGLIGADMILQLSAQQMQYYKTRPWYKGKKFRLRNGKPADNGQYAVFVAGGFFAIKTEAIRAADVPDVALTHNGGDYTIGEQLYQNDYGIKGWNRQKQFIHTSSVPRRGESQAHFGTAQWLANR